jgi:hypothetical protein
MVLKCTSEHQERFCVERTVRTGRSILRAIKLQLDRVQITATSVLLGSLHAWRRNVKRGSMRRLKKVPRFELLNFSGVSAGAPRLVEDARQSFGTKNTTISILGKASIASQLEWAL